jgi:hypothetical protein
VTGELVGSAMMFAVPATGIIFTALFVQIMWRRVRVEERALGLRK